MSIQLFMFRVLISNVKPNVGKWFYANYH